jgi:hypothetical protein
MEVGVAIESNTEIPTQDEKGPLLFSVSAIHSWM